MQFTLEEPTQDENGIWSDRYDVNYFWVGLDDCLFGYHDRGSGNTSEVEPWRHGKERKEIEVYMLSVVKLCNNYIAKNSLTDLINVSCIPEAGFVQLHFESNNNFVPPYEHIFLEFYYGYLINNEECLVECMLSEFGGYLASHYKYAKSKRVSNSFKERKALLCDRLQVTIAKLNKLLQ